MDNYLIPEWGNRPAQSIRRPEAIKLIEEIANTHRGAARNVLLAARALFEFGVDREYVTSNPFQKVGRSVPQATANSRARVLTHDEIRLLWHKLSHGYGSSHVRTILKLILLLGQRPGEVAAMRYEHIVGDWWTIPKAETKTGKNPNIDEKVKFDHRVFLPPLAKELIGPILKSGHVFTPRGKPIVENSLSSHVLRVITSRNGIVTKEKYYGLPAWVPHDLRRTMATRLAEDLDADYRYINAMLGHVIPGILGIYVRAKFDARKRTLGLAWEKLLLDIINKQDSTDPQNGESSANPESTRILTNNEIKIIWEGLATIKSEHSSRALKLVLLTGQEVSACATIHREQISTETTGTWWNVPGGNKIILTTIAMSLLDKQWNLNGYAFAPRGKPLTLAVLSHHILSRDSFGLAKWTPQDLRRTVAFGMRKMGASAGIVDAIEKCAQVNQWELRYWLEKWAEHIERICGQI